MNTVHPVMRPWRMCAALACCWLALLFNLQAQNAGSGTIRGRIFNPVSKESVRNAEVRLQGTTQLTYSENDGTVEFLNVVAGPAAISITYTGYNAVNESFTVSAGQVAVREINLTSSSTAVSPKDGVVQLQAFTVSSEPRSFARRARIPRW